MEQNILILIASFLTTETCVCVCVYIYTHTQRHRYKTFSLSSSNDGHFSCFNILAIVLINNATVNIGDHVFFKVIIFVFFGKIFKSRLAGSCSSSWLIF